MTMSTASLPRTLRETFSFYVGGRNAERIRACSEQSDAVVVAGVKGPSTVRGLREVGWSGTVIFDGMAYDKREFSIDPLQWLDEQRSAGADRILTPGIWVGAAPGHLPFDAQVEDEVRLAVLNNATCLIAIDRRWLTKSSQLDEMKRCLQGLNVPAALVLGDQSDPMKYPGAVEGLVAISKAVDKLSILRCDQAGIGALAFGATHASLGLTASHRHVVPPGENAFARRNDWSARVFVRELLDWFTASRIGELSTTKVAPICHATCCKGERIDRFLDERRKHEADLHNRTVLAALAEEILEAPVEDGVRRKVFGQICHEAVVRYGVMGDWKTEISPKPQLTQWALYC